MKKIVLLGLCLCALTASYCQNSKMAGKVKVKTKNTTAIGGYVRDAHKHPIPGIEAFIYKPDSTIAASGYTDATGYFETNAVMPGKYDLKIVYPSNKNALVSGVIIKKGVTMVSLYMDEPAADTLIAYTDLVPKAVENKKRVIKKK